MDGTLPTPKPRQDADLFGGEWIGYAGLLNSGDFVKDILASERMNRLTPTEPSVTFSASNS
jgi:hypothetical protein